jgi:AraC-like DNA-binding protein
MEVEQVKKNKNMQARSIYVVPDAIVHDIKKHPLAHSLYFSDIGCFEHAENHIRERENGCEQAILIYCYQGHGYYIENHQRIEVEPNTLLFIPENTPHLYASSNDKPWSILWIHMKGNNLYNFYSYEEKKASILFIPMEKQSEIKTLFEDIFTILEQGYQLENLLYSYQILAHIMGMFFLTPNYNRLSRKNSDSSIHASIHYMTHSIGETLSLDELAKHSSLSPAHYSYLFKKNTGYSPIHYFLRLKIQKACHYLDISDWAIGEIATQLGFKDAFYFSRLFHKIMGMSPSDYRRKQKG